MILIEASHWPLVVVGESRSATIEAGARQTALTRWRSRDLRLVALVVPGVGDAAFDAHNQLVGWLGEQVLTLARYCRGLAWVIPDEAVRQHVASLLDTHDHFAYGCPCAVFPTVSGALGWLTCTARCDRCPWKDDSQILR